MDSFGEWCRKVWCWLDENERAERDDLTGARRADEAGGMCWISG